MTVPVHIITGFLGSGKTTLLNRLLASPDMADSAVLINEFGETAVDHLLVENIDDDIVVLESGCVCCSVRDDLAGALRTLWEKREQNLIPSFRRVILETTGIADPLPVCRQIMTDELVTPYYCNGAIVTVVDGVYGDTNLDRHVESIRQVVVADHLVLTKIDLVNSQQLDLLEKRLQKLNPSASISHRDAVSGTGELFPGLSENRTRQDPEQWLTSMADMDPNTSTETGHDTRFGSFCIRWRQPMAWNDFTAWLEVLLLARGEQILRIKGIINQKEETRPIFIQGVQHTVYAPVKLESWPGEPRTELIFITQDFSKEAVINSIQDVLDVECQ
ncbi:MAG: GTP-binding protein [Gammaproteobacteria bacterium]